MLEPFLIAFLLLIFKGYKPREILSLKIVCLFAGVILLNVIIAVMFATGVWQMVNYAKTILKLFYILLLCGLIIAYRNNLQERKLFIWMIVALTGIISNSIVIWANNGCMPVRPVFNHNENLFVSGPAGYALIDENTKLPYLGDIIDLKFEIYSIGDVLIIAFISYLIYAIIIGQAQMRVCNDDKHKQNQ